MKKLSYILGLALLSHFGIPVHAQSQSASAQTPPATDSAATPKTLLLSLGYGNTNQKAQYLKATAKTKLNGKFTLVAGIALRFYIKADSPQYLLGKAVTSENGEAYVYFTPAFHDLWLASPHQHFIVDADPAQGFPATTTEADITRARLQIDTVAANTTAGNAAAGRSVTVRLTELRDNGWSPVKGVDVKVAVKRFGGDLNIGDAPTYTTDSTGALQADFKLDSLPGDAHGNLVLVAGVDDNDTYGTLSAETVAPWGVYQPWVSSYDRRTLFARRGRSPYWLELIAYSIIALVWGTLLYLLLQLRKLRRLGSHATEKTLLT